MAAEIKRLNAENKMIRENHAAAWRHRDEEAARRFAAETQRDDHRETLMLWRQCASELGLDPEQFGEHQARLFGEEPTP